MWQSLSRAEENESDSTISSEFVHNSSGEPSGGVSHLTVSKPSTHSFTVVTIVSLDFYQPVGHLPHMPLILMRILANPLLCILVATSFWRELASSCFKLTLHSCQLLSAIAIYTCSPVCYCCSPVWLLAYPGIEVSCQLYIHVQCKLERYVDRWMTERLHNSRLIHCVPM